MSSLRQHSVRQVFASVRIPQPMIDMFEIQPRRTMSSARTPQEKKRLAYERDHYAKSEHDKARNGWRTKKHKARRSYRHAADSLTRAAAFDEKSDSKISAIKQRPHGRWTVPSLRQRVAHKLDRRVRSIGAKKARRKAHERRHCNGLVPGVWRGYQPAHRLISAPAKRSIEFLSQGSRG